MEPHHLNSRKTSTNNLSLYFFILKIIGTSQITQDFYFYISTNFLVFAILD